MQTKYRANIILKNGNKLASSKHDISWALQNLNKKVLQVLHMTSIEVRANIFWWNTFLDLSTNKNL